MWINDLNEFRKQFPKAKVLFSVNDGIFGDYDSIYTSDATVYTNEFAEYNDKLLEEDDLREEISYDIVSGNPDAREWSDENFELEIDDVIKTHEIEFKTYIIVNIG